MLYNSLNKLHDSYIFQCNVGMWICRTSMLAPFFQLITQDFGLLVVKKPLIRYSNGRKTKPISQIKQLLQLLEQGKNKKLIACSLGISKNTVKAYLAKLAASPLNIESLLTLDDPVLEGKFHPGNPAHKDVRFDHFKEKPDCFSTELTRVGVTKQ
jgi:hypothetical protein